VTGTHSVAGRAGGVIRIAREEAETPQDARTRAATLAIRATERLLADELDGPRAQALLVTRSPRKLS
jgi:hypothetical protein